MTATPAETKPTALVKAATIASRVQLLTVMQALTTTATKRTGLKFVMSLTLAFFLNFEAEIIETLAAWLTPLLADLAFYLLPFGAHAAISFLYIGFKRWMKLGFAFNDGHPYRACDPLQYSLTEPFAAKVIEEHNNVMASYPSHSDGKWHALTWVMVFSWQMTLGESRRAHLFYTVATTGFPVLWDWLQSNALARTFTEVSKQLAPVTTFSWVTLQFERCEQTVSPFAVLSIEAKSKEGLPTDDSLPTETFAAQVLKKKSPHARRRGTVTPQPNLLITQPSQWIASEVLISIITHYLHETFQSAFFFQQGSQLQILIDLSTKKLFDEVERFKRLLSDELPGWHQQLRWLDRVASAFHQMTGSRAIEVNVLDGEPVLTMRGVKSLTPLQKQWLCQTFNLARDTWDSDEKVYHVTVSIDRRFPDQDSVPRELRTLMNESKAEGASSAFLTTTCFYSSRRERHLSLGSKRTVSKEKTNVTSPIEDRLSQTPVCFDDFGTSADKHIVQVEGVHHGRLYLYNLDEQGEELITGKVNLARGKHSLTGIVYLSSVAAKHKAKNGARCFFQILTFAGEQGQNNYLLIPTACLTCNQAHRQRTLARYR